MHIMNKLGMITAGVVVMGAATAAHFTKSKDLNPSDVQSAIESNDPPKYAPSILKEPVPASIAEVDRYYEDAARTAWQFLDRGYVPKTGLIMAQSDWPYPTVWDIASTLAAYYSARGLGFISNDEYVKRTGLALQTLKAAKLYDNVAYGRNYDARSGELVGAGHEAAGNGVGFSAIDLGRLLVWLKIVQQSSPELAGLAQDVAKRINVSRTVRGGYLYGETLPGKGKLMVYQEGRIGYEQYSAAGFQLWGFPADRAADLAANALPTAVKNIPVFADKRKLDRLTSEPIILYGMEIGLTGKMRELAWQTLSLQAQRYKETGQITAVSEDALGVPPHYFYYYCVYCSGKAFVINVHEPGKEMNEPRWISTKAAFAWHALLPNQYTWKTVQAVKAAHDPAKGWASGVMEKTGKSTGTLALNTSAVILEAALYRKTGRSFLQSRS